MRRRSLVSKLFPVHFLIALSAVVIMGVLAIGDFGRFYYAQVERELEIRARLIARYIAEDNLLVVNPRGLAHLARSLDESSDTRITLIALDGAVLADSRKDSSTMENHSDRPEFRKALLGKAGAVRRKSPTLGVTMIYAAAPVRTGAQTRAVLRVSVAADLVDAASSGFHTRFAIAAILIALLTGLASLFAARRISKPLGRMKDAARRFGSGDRRVRVPVPDTEELASLAETLNDTASLLDQQLDTITQQTREQQAIMSAMKECVIAVDNNDRLILLNPAAEALLDARLDSARGSVIQETIRNSELQEFFQQMRDDGAALSREIVFRGDPDRVMQAVGAPLLEADRRRTGAVVVLNDVTQMRKLENVRKDFVANVSHELKTPITAIKGYVEALQHGAIAKPKEAEQFLGIVARQTDRLNAIIDDLLALSRIEQSVGTEEIELAAGRICPVIEAARLTCQGKAAEAGVEVEIECDSSLSAGINAALLEQALTNLLDNAIKYSEKGSGVTMHARSEKDEVAIRVIDRGQGIEPEHLDRIFERFYRVDKARSRQHGGTGLGLSIVKHIVQLHGGRISVESTPGKGSTFTIALPPA